MPTVVLLLVSVGVLLGIGFIIYDEVGDSAAITETVSAENITVLNGTAVSMANGNLTQFLSAINATNLVNIPSTNYTVALAAGTFTLMDNTSLVNDNDLVTVSYKYKEYQTKTRQTMTDVMGSVDDISSTWLSLIIVVVMLAIIMTLVIRAFVTRGGR